jgi:cysteinyl-tRNA synthetase
MKLHNTLSRKVEPFKTIKAGQTKLYTCGPTVYDDQTIGNLRTYVLYDTLSRALRAGGYTVDHVMNITDVGHLTSDADAGEDKLEKGAKRAGKTVWEVADHYITLFNGDLKKLNVIKPRIARATDFIDAQIVMVKILMDKGFGYQTEQAIYFDITKFPTYGELTGQNLSDKEVGARSEVITDKTKRNPQDFALWFFAVGRFAGHEMKWPSPWGEGFPGWHLECSAIIHETLGDPIDIHAGAVDLIGTHHTNEMAQTEAAYGNKLANYWVHGEHLLVDEKRMAKSLGNFYTLQDVMKKGYDPLALRLLYLQAHYRHQLNFTWEALDGAQAFLNRLRDWADLRFQPNLGHKKTAAAAYEEVLDKIKQSLANDLNTGQALVALSELANLSEQYGVDVNKLGALLPKVDELLGLDLAKRQAIDQPLKELIEEREQARRAKDWPKADELRARLGREGIELDDTPHGPVWSKKS